MISALTLTYNQKRMMLRLARSMLIHCGQENFEWLVMDNGKDGTATALSKYWKWKAARLGVSPSLKIFIGENKGNFASMNNFLAKHAEGDILCFLNNDTEFRSNAFALAKETLTKYPIIKVLGSILKFRYRPHLQHVGIVLTDNVCPGEIGAKVVYDLKLHSDYLRPDKWTEPVVFRAVTAACSFMRIKDFRAIGRFNSEFQWCFDDVDLCLRATLWLNGVCATDPRIILTHVASASGGDRKIAYNYELLKGRFKGIFFKDVELFKMPPEFNYITSFCEQVRRNN